MTMSYTQLVAAITTILPKASFGEDYDGQIVIYTDLEQRDTDDDMPLAPFHGDSTIENLTKDWQAEVASGATKLGFQDWMGNVDEI
jgi:hypothetical protein